MNFECEFRLLAYHTDVIQFIGTKGTNTNDVNLSKSLIQSISINSTSKSFA